MPLLFPAEIMDAICRELKEATESVDVLTAYAKKDAVEIIIRNVDPAIRKKGS